MVIMLCDPEHDGLQKCTNYTEFETSPYDQEFKLHYDPKIDMVKLNTQVTKRTFTLMHKESGLMRKVDHYSYSKWIDNKEVDTAQAEKDLMQLVDKMVEHREQTSTPILTHCSAGVGRSGTT